MPKLEKINEVRHSLAHLLAAAVLKKFPKAKLGIGPVIENGFYYDFKLPRPLTEVDLKELEHTMRALVMEKLPFSGKKISPAAAKKLFKDQPFKLDLIKEFQKDKKPLTIYITGKAINAKYQIPDTKYFVDLCRGGHVKNTGEINSEGFKLTSIAGAYWRGNEKNPQLQRIYGLAFGSGKELKDYETLMEEAKKRDHRKLGKELKLFTIVDEIGAGLPLFYPKGAILRRIVENFIIEMQEKRGYVPIWIPHITKGELYKISGHLDKYDAMYPPMKLKGEADYYLKPMNCPHFMMLYKSEPHSYKELPIRMTSTTTNYRYEKSGELSGLTRVRSLTQDDCHVFSAPEQIEGEINLMLDMIDETYSAFRFKDFWVRISTHDPKDKDKYIGDPKIWKQSENILEKLITKRGWKNEVVPGEAAFYGPKLDFMAKDVLGREWQLSTIQLDMNLPKRFGLEYIDEKGNKRQPIVIHRAILGSTERFLGILIEHYGGDFPVWLSPIQARIIPISDRHREYAEKILKALKDSNVRSDIAPEGETLGKNIRGGELEKIPYLLVVGDKEIEEKSVNVRERHKKETFVSSVEKFIERIKKEEKDR
ncbi:threonine--tRNA ligase [Patescibacteria group bacterium]|nr:threonine--tRNA ligase [Patescibacteria group bacterium]